MDWSPSRSQELRRLAMVVRHTKNIVIITDAQRRAVWVNEAFTRVTGYTPAEVIGRSPGSLLQCEKSDPAVVARMREALTAGRGCRVELMNRAKSGREYVLDIDIQPFFREDGRLEGFIAVELDITEQVRQREAMAVARRQLETAAALTGSGWWELPLDTMVPVWSEIVREIHDAPEGYTPDIETALSYYPGEAKERIGEAIRRAIEEGEAFDIELPFVTFRGRHRWVRAAGRRVDVDGKPVRVAGAFADVTDEVRARFTIESERHRLSTIIDATNVGTWEWNVATGEATINACYAGMLGYEPAEVTPFTYERWRSMIHPDDREAAESNLRAHFESRASSYLARFRMRHADGRWVWIEARGRVVSRDEAGMPLMMYGTHLDITGSVEAMARLDEAKASAERALRESEALRSTLDHHSIFSVADARGRIVEVNDEFCRISGYSREELIGQDHSILNSGHHPRQFWVDLWRTLASGNAWHGEICNRRKDGTLYWVDSIIAPFRDANGKIEKYVSIRSEITARKQAEQALREARAAAEGATRAKSEFLANMSHEIRTPMTAILGYADLLAEECAGDPRASRLEYIGTIKRNGEHLLSIINDILDVSKIEAGKMSVELVATDPRAILREVAELMRVRADAKGIALRVEVGEGVPGRVLSDPLRLRQILVNLIGNAIKFTEIGCVSVGARVEAGGTGGTIRIDVRDTGIGIPPEKLALLFNAFTQADSSTTRRFGGTGLGLRITKSLAELMGGTILVESTVGRGSVFSLSLPIERAASEEATRCEPRAENARVQSGKPLAGMRILLAEDGPDNLRLISFHLRRAGADVRTVENGRQALEGLTRNGREDGELMDPAPVDLLLTDMQMPEMDGYELARRLRAKGSKLRIVALTAHAMSGDAQRCMDAGCDGYASKPIDRERLIMACLSAGSGGPTVLHEAA